MDKLTDHAIAYICEQYAKESSLRDYKTISRILGKLPFFHKFSTDIRLKLLVIAEIVVHEKNEVIFRQGDQGDFMYVIIRGSVGVYKTSQELGEGQVLVRSLYDGDSFGELALFVSNNKTATNVNRAATIKSTEKCILFSIPKSLYHELLQKIMHKDVEEKVRFLLKLPFFQDLPLVELIPLATNLEYQYYGLHDKIIVQGEMPKGLYIIVEGYCSVMTEGVAMKYTHGGEYSNPRTRKKQPEPFIMGLTSERSESRLQKELEILKNDPLIAIMKRNESQLTGEMSFRQSHRGSPSKDYYLLEERVRYYNIHSEDFFGGRALLEGEFFKDETQEKVIIRCRTVDPSKFSIIVQSDVAKIFIITKELLNFLSEHVQAQLKTVLLRSYELDCPPEISINDTRSYFTWWQNYKKNLIENIRIERFVSKKL